MWLSYLVSDQHLLEEPRVTWTCSASGFTFGTGHLIVEVPVLTCLECLRSYGSEDTPIPVSAPLFLLKNPLSSWP